MADNNFRSNANRDQLARGVDDAREAAHDPLAELARLIGQGDPYAEQGARRSVDEPRPGFDWAADQECTQNTPMTEGRRKSITPRRYLRRFRRFLIHPLLIRPTRAMQQDYADGASRQAGDIFPGPAGKFNGFGDDADRLRTGRAHAGFNPSQLPAFMAPRLRGLRGTRPRGR